MRNLICLGRRGSSILIPAVVAPKKFTAQQQQVADYKAKGLTTREIGRLIGKSHARVVQILAELRRIHERQARERDQ